MVHQKTRTMSRIHGLTLLGEIKSWFPLEIKYLLPELIFSSAIYSILTAFVGVLLSCTVVLFIGTAVVLDASFLLLNLRHRLNSFHVFSDTVIFSEGCVFRYSSIVVPPFLLLILYFRALYSLMFDGRSMNCTALTPPAFFVFSTCLGLPFLVKATRLSLYLTELNSV